MKSVITILVLLVLSGSTTTAQNNDLPGVIVEIPRIKAEWKSYDLDLLLHNILLESLSDMDGIVHVIDSDELSTLEKVRKSFLKNQPDIASSQMIGAQYILESKVLDYKEDIRSYNKSVKTGQIGKLTTTKKGACVNKSMEIFVKINMSLVSVETSDVVSTREIEVSGFAHRSCLMFGKEKEIVRNECFTDFRPCMGILMRKNVMHMLDVKVKVEGLLQSKKESAKKLVIKSGSPQSLSRGTALDVIQVSTKDIAGEKVVSEKPIGKAVVESAREGYSILEVDKGGKDIYASLSNNGELYVKYGSKYRRVDCTGKNQPSSRAKTKKSLEPKEEEEEDKK